MTNEEVMKTMTELGLHEGGMANWVTDNSWVMFANVIEQRERKAFLLDVKKVLGSFDSLPESATKKFIEAICLTFIESISEEVELRIQQ